jgi:DNA-directed RNA polymerase subunit RPC12/RpoP
MSAYKTNVVAWLALMGLLMALGVLALYVSTWFLAPFFVVVLSAQFVLKKIRCPHCGTPVTYQGEYGGSPLHAGLVRTHCQKCGHDLREAASAS